MEMKKPRTKVSKKEMRKAGWTYGPKETKDAIQKLEADEQWKKEMLKHIDAMERILHPTPPPRPEGESSPSLPERPLP